MSVKNFLLTAGVFGLALIAGCTKTTSTSPTSTFKYTMAGSPFSGVAAAQKSGTVLNITGASSFTGTTPTYPYGIINIFNFTGNKTYDISLLEAAATIAPSSSASHPAIYGKVIVTSSSPNIVGTFYFTALDSTKVTSGSFSVPAP